ncbi:MAG TPA: hypothetical protein VNU94_06355 [Acidobacteriaceae bacterium]|nr:hypothetical protein [Acidobacteriaceae bacterium]
MGDVRATQGFVHTLSRCRRRPSLTLLEIAWRWAFGIPTLAILYFEGTRILAETSFAGTGIDTITFTDPMGAAVALSSAIGRMWQPVVSIALWLVPLLALVWVVVSSVGRTLVLRRMVTLPAHARIGTVILLQLVRLLALGGSLAVWFGALRLASREAIWAPLLAGGEPNLVGYFAMVIVASLGLFTLWGVVSWIFAAAPLLAQLEGLGFSASLRTAITRRELRGPMVEINLVMGIVKIALIVLAMVFSATPLPFESVATPEFMHWWYLGVTIWYCVASDFFHVARLMQYVDYAHPESQDKSSARI